MIYKKRYLVLIIVALLVIGLFLGDQHINSHNLDGIYYPYSNYDKVDTDNFDTHKIIIKGDKLTYISEKNDKDGSSWNLDLKKKTISHAGEASTAYTVKGDIFSFFEYNGESRIFS